MDFLSWRWLNPITLEAINPQQCNFPSRQDLPGFPPGAPCCSLSFLCNIHKPRLSSSVPPSFILTFSSFIPSLSFSPLSFYIVHMFSLSRHPLLCLFQPVFCSPTSVAFQASLAPFNAPSLSYYTALPATFTPPPLLPAFLLFLLPCHPRPFSHHHVIIAPFFLCVPQHCFSSIMPHHLSSSYYLTYTHLSFMQAPHISHSLSPYLLSMLVFSKLVRTLQTICRNISSFCDDVGCA